MKKKWMTGMLCLMTAGFMAAAVQAEEVDPVLLGKVMDVQDAYANVLYAVSDLDGDGIDELLLSCGNYDADWQTKVYVYGALSDEYEYLDAFSGNVGLYEAPDGRGLYTVYGTRGFQVLNQVYIENGLLRVEAVGDAQRVETYYENDHPVEWIRFR